MSTVGGVSGACSRCGNATDSKPAVSETATVETSTEWQREQRMKQIGRSLRVPLASTTSASGEQTVHWLDIAAMNTGEPSLAARRAEAERQRIAASKPTDYRTQWFAWFVMSVGLGLVGAGVWTTGIGFNR